MAASENGSSYIKRLAGMRKQAVVASVDIYNEHGLLLLKKGFPIDPRKAELLVVHKLLQPIEESVNFDKLISASDLYERLVQNMRGCADLLALEARWTLFNRVRSYCQDLAGFPLLSQKLTVMAEQLPHTLDKCLLTAYLATGLAQGANWPESQQRAAFFAAALHELGMLHLPQELLTKEGAYTAEEHRTMQAHSVIGQTILTNVRGLPAGVDRAVLEHHERCDGSGYPKGLFGGDLSPLGKLLGLADTIQALRFGKRNVRHLTLSHLVPILQLSGDLFATDLLAVAQRELREQHHEDGRYAALELPELARKVAGGLRDQQQVARLLADQPLTIDRSHRVGSSLEISLHHYLNTVNQAGLLFEALPGYVEQMGASRRDTDPHAQHQLEEMELLVEELQFLCRRLQHKLELAGRQGKMREAGRISEMLGALSQKRPQQQEG